MKIVIHGTKGGYHIFTPEKAKTFDVRPESSRIAAIGNQAYAINFIDGNVVYSLYCIIRDVIGDKRTGNIAFSVVIPQTQRLSGFDVKKLLDQLKDDFYQKHKIADDNNLGDFREDWKFIDAIKDEFKTKITSSLFEDSDIIQQGFGKAPYAYYASDYELVKYFEDSLWNEYRPYKMVFFVENNLQGQPHNPLKALNHDPNNNLTEELKPENKKYYLKGFNGKGDNGITIRIKVNGIEKKDTEAIKENDTITIEYSNDPYFDLKIIGPGRLVDLVPKFLNKDGNKIIVKTGINLVKSKKPISVKVKGPNGEEIDNVSVIYKKVDSNDERKGIKKNNEFEIEFVGEEQKYSWIVSANTTDYFAKSDPFIPAPNFSPIELHLKRYLKVTFTAKDEEYPEAITGFKLEIHSKKEVKNGNIIEFYGDEIDDTWKITISHKGYLSKIFDFRPSEDGKKTNHEIPLKKSSYSAVENQNNRNSQNDNPNPTNNTQSPSNNERKRFFPQIFLFVCLILFISVIAIYFFFFSKNANNPSTLEFSESQVVQYVDGTQLYLSKLEEYRQVYNCDNFSDGKQTNKSEQSLWDKFFPSGKQTKTKYDNTELCRKIENAINLRKAINNGYIDELKVFTYSDQQIMLRVAIDKIEDKYSIEIARRMNFHEVSKMNLEEVADFITNLQILLKIDVNSLKTDQDFTDKLREINDLNFPITRLVDSVKDQINLKRPKEQAQNQPEQKPKSKEIKPKTQVKGLPVPQKPEKESSLELEFWSLVNSLDENKESYKTLLNKYNNETGQIIVFLKKICKTSKAFDKFKVIPAIERKKAKTLKDIDK